EERRRRHVVAGDRQAVLEAGDAAAGGVEVGGRLGAAGRPLGDEERADDEGGEHADRGPVGRLLLGLAEIGTGCPGELDDGERGGAREDGPEQAAAHFRAPWAICSDSSSYSPLARRT